MKIPRDLEEFLQLYLSDKRGIPYPVANIQKQTYALDVAENMRREDFSGDFVYADRTGEGVIGVRFNNPGMPAFPFAQNTAVRGFPFKEVYLNWTAQPGETVTLWYGYGAEIIPPNQDITQILSTVSIQDVGMIAGSSYQSSTAKLINSVNNIFAAASNVNGVIIHNGKICNFNVTNLAQVTMLAKATAPGTVVDGDVIISPDSMSQFAANFVAIGSLNNKIRLASGLRLDIYNTTAEGGSYIDSVDYTLL